MQRFNSLLLEIPLFDGLNEMEITSLLTCLPMHQKSYHNDSIIFLAGEMVSHIGIVLEGKVRVLREDVWGNRTIVSELGRGQIFAEVFVCAKVKVLPITVQAVSECHILFIDYNKIGSCTASCSFHARMTYNMLTILAQKNILLNEKIDLLSRRTTREKLLAYLYDQAQKSSSASFSIPYNRQELANYLGVERSAMSHELSKLRDEGLITFRRSSFQLQPHLFHMYESQMT